MQGFVGGVVWGVVTVGLGLAALSLSKPVGRAPDVADTGQAAVASASVAPRPDAEVAVDTSVFRRDPDLIEMAPSSLAPASQSARDGAHADTDPGTRPDPAKQAGPLAAPTMLEPARVAVAIDDVTGSAAAIDPLPPAGDAEAMPQVDARSDDGATAAVPVFAAAATGPLSEPRDGAAPVVVASTDAARPGTRVEDVAAPALESGFGVSTVSAAVPTSVVVSDVATGGARMLDTQPRISREARAPAPVRATPAAGTPKAEETLVVADVTPAKPLPPFERKPLPQAESQPRIAATPKPAATVATPDAARAPDASPVRASVGKRVVPLTERGTQVAKIATPPAPVAEPEALALMAHAMPFENPQNKPILSIVLIDDMESLGIEALGDFPYPVTFGIDPNHPGAADRMARHRAAGFEVVALVDLPAGATAQDAEVSLASIFDTLPEALAVLEGFDTGVQGSRDLSQQVNAFAAATGRGVVLQANGLNSALRLAERDNVPAAVVFRDFDGAGQSPTTIRRFMDQAAFRARQEGGVVMLGRVRPDTISALLLWGAQDRSNRVALAPVSAMLTQASR